jgi:hypothetical protein
MAINFKSYVVRGENGVVDEARTIAKFRAELTNYVNNLEPDTTQIKALVDEVLVANRGITVNADFVASQVATKLSEGNPGNFSPLKRMTLQFISDNSKDVASTYVTGKGRNSEGLRLRADVPVKETPAKTEVKAKL